METKRASSSRHREWRRLAKKERRRRVRRKAAQERDADDERLRATLERSADYTNWLEEQEKRETERVALEQREHDEKERLWLEEEVRAQKEWRVHQERRAKARQEKLQQEETIRKEFEAKQEALRKRKEENKRLYEEEIKRHEDVRKQIDEYIDNGARTPEALRVVTESQSGKELCPFFTKTGACRYGESCSRNHRRLALSRVILIPGFYSHFSLEKNSAEYDTDVSLEFEGSETRHHFREFYDEVVPELERFGRIKTLKYCCNTEIHLRGNLYVEYRSEREAARAWRKLKGRYWAGRQLNCEFVNMKSWRDAVCGMNKCPKGRACNFLHTFRNPNDEYDVKSPPRWAKKKEGQDGGSSRRSEQRLASKWDEFDRSSADESRNWRWSESPEPGLNPRAKSEKTRRSTEDRRSSRGERRREDESERSNLRSERRRDDDSERSNLRSERRRDDDSERSNSRSERRRDDDSERSNSRSERRRDDDSVRSISRDSPNDLSDQRRRKRRKEAKNEEEIDSKPEERNSRKHTKKSKKRRAEHEAEDKEERKDSNSRKSKATKTGETPERIRHSEKKIRDGKSRDKSRTEKEESDENIDTNSDKSWTKIRRSETEDEKRIAKPPKARWDEVESDSATPNDLNRRNSAPNEEREIEQRPTKRQTLPADENAWDTTDSESEEKWKERSP